MARGNRRPLSGQLDSFARVLRRWLRAPGWPLRALVAAGVVLALGAMAVQFWVGAGLVRTNAAASDVAGRQSLIASLIHASILEAEVAHRHGREAAFHSAVARARRYVELFVEGTDVLSRGGSAPAVPLDGEVLPPIAGVPPGALEHAPRRPVFQDARAAARQWEPVLARLDSLAARPLATGPERSSSVVGAVVARAVADFDALSAALTARNEKLVVLSRWLPLVFLAAAAFLAVLALIQLVSRLSLETHISQIEGQLQARGLAAAALETVQKSGRVSEIWMALARLLQRHTGAYGSGVYRPYSEKEGWGLVAAAGLDPGSMGRCLMLPQPDLRLGLPPYGQEVFECAACPLRHGACPAETHGVEAVAIVPGHGERAPEEVFGLVWRSGTKASRDVDVRSARMLAPHARLAVDRVRTLEQVSEAKRQWEATVDAVPESIAVTDAGRRILRVNRGFARALGRTPGELVGELLGEVLGMDPESLSWRAHAEGERGDRAADHSVTAEAEIPALGARVGITRSTVVGLAPANAFVYVFRDITRERTAEEAARRSERPAR